MTIWACLYISDYALTNNAARMHYAGVINHIVFEKEYELTPYFQKDVALLRRFSPWFILC